MGKIKTGPLEQDLEQSLVISRIINAPPELVFKAWTQPQRMMRWWGPKGFSCPVCKIDLRQGGSYLNCMRSPDGKDYWSKGVYRQIIEPQRIVCTDMFADEHGNTVSPQDYGMSPDWPLEATIELTFEDMSGKTVLTIRHWPLKPGPDRDQCRQGWEESLDKLENYLSDSQE